MVEWLFEIHELDNGFVYQGVDPVALVFAALAGLVVLVQVARGKM